MANLDKIKISKLLIRGIVGINDDERVKEQDIIVNLCLYADLKEACLSDDINDTVDYKTIKLKVIDIVKQSRCFLVERLAELIANECLSHQRVKKVKVNVQKPGALRFTKTVGFTIVRT